MAWGYDTYHRAEDGHMALDLAAAAAREAMDASGLEPDAVDFVVLAHSEMQEYFYWEASAALAREIGVRTTHSLLLTEGCAAGTAGLGLLAGLMATNDDLNRGLFVAVNRVSESHRNRMTVNNAVHSDGAVAAVVKRGHERLRWLATHQMTDSDFCEWFRNDYGGAAHPSMPDGWTAHDAPSGSLRVQEHFARDPRRLREFGELLNERIHSVTESACNKAGVSLGDIKFVAYINDSQDTMDEIAEMFDLPPERSSKVSARQHGHMGAADQLVALKEAVERGDVQPGDVVALTGISIGLRWYCTLIEV